MFTKNITAYNVAVNNLNNALKTDEFKLFEERFQELLLNPGVVCSSNLKEVLKSMTPQVSSLIKFGKNEINMIDARKYVNELQSLNTMIINEYSLERLKTECENSFI